MTGQNARRLTYDVVVVGGGVTGLCAAMASARNGARTALIQDRPVLGGNASSEVRMHICGASANMSKPDLSEGGILHELMLENKRVNDSHNYSIWDGVLFSAAKRQQNLTLYLNTAMHGVNRQGDAVQSVTCYQMTTEAHLEFFADIFVDCTGNGTVGAFAGLPFRTGSEAAAEFSEPHAPREANKDRMGNTLLFKAANAGRPVKFIPPVDIIHFTEEQLKYRKHTPALPEQITENATQAEIRMLFDGYCQDYGYWWIEIPGESDDIIAEYETIRDQLVAAVYGVWDHIKNGGDHGADNYELVWVGMLPGVRESRRMVADYTLNENDVLENRLFDDAVAYGGWHIDNHVPGGLFAFDKMPSFVLEFPGAYTIPYRAFCAAGLDNLFVAGRAMSATKLAMASSRVMGTCAISGQAVGTAAALCVRHGVSPRGLLPVVGELQQTLLKDDCYIPGIAHADPKDLAKGAKVSASSQREGFEAANVINGVTRTLESASNAWHSDGLAQGGEWLRLELSSPAQVGQVQLTLDSNFHVEKKITLSSRRQAQQVAGIPPELLRDCDIELLRDGQTVAAHQLRQNYQRLCRVEFPKTLCDAVRIRALATNGVPDARIFEVRIYE